ncbi:hypothetical protein [Pseudodesulfovibrio sp. zrk46]|uniref:hypothetical protein n=1 Tax=Pseudodesulfovibrio sp. zrk46 TaxID=2725288 RepID=UPI001449D099|nr:hypothetical protein [Pseudodesulfovibrio sp. zrk46]QJB57853.1 hypothetical protein HFN16_16240 [Pseudodesulfovibrio sp. zrk46]
MSDVKRLPGDGCRHHINKRCLYDEHLNPGYAEGFRCRVLLRWEIAFDEFLERADAFNIEQDAVPDLWGRKFERMARQAFDCEKYEFAGGEAPACAQVYDGLCLLALPQCEGRCRHFFLVDED